MSTHAESHLETTRRFAEALDHADFDAAGTWLSGDCVYRLRGETFVGPTDILASYRVHDEKAKATFDHVAYESSVEAIAGDRVRIVFVDLVEHQGVSVRHTCHQLVTFDDRGRIRGIEHVDLEPSPGAEGTGG